jgi:hypothetical protein
MSRKALISPILGALLITACTTPRTTVEVPATTATVVTAESSIVPPNTIRPSTSTHPTAPLAAQSATPTAPQPQLASLIRANVTRDGNTLYVSRGAANAPVPLFRQAIVLANVRSALANTPATAEFRRGILTVTFPRGTAQQIASAINRTLQVPEVNRLRAVVPAGR